MVQEIVIAVQNLLEEIACFGERIKKCGLCSSFHSYFTMSFIKDFNLVLMVNAMIFRNTKTKSTSSDGRSLHKNK